MLTNVQIKFPIIIFKNLIFKEGSLPDSFGDGSCGLLTNEHVACEPLQSGVLRDEAEVAMIARVKRTE